MVTKMHSKLGEVIAGMCNIPGGKFGGARFEVRIGVGEEQAFTWQAQLQHLSSIHDGLFSCIQARELRAGEHIRRSTASRIV